MARFDEEGEGLELQGEIEDIAVGDTQSVTSTSRLGTTC